MAILQKIDSNVTGLRFAEEESLAVLPTSGVVWFPLEPNSYDNFGGEITTVARNPINASRQRQKGVVTDLDASGGLNSDLTQENMQDLLQGYYFADLRRKNDVGDDRTPRREGFQGEFEDYLMTDINGGTEVITVDSRVAASAAVVAGGTGYAVGDVVEVTPVSATVNARFIVSTEAAGVVTAVVLQLSGFSGGNEGRASTDTAVGAATTAITGGGDDALTLTVTYANGLTWQAGDLIFLNDNNTVANDGLKNVTVVTDNLITVAEDLITDATPAADATMTTVGFLGATGDIDVDATQSLPALTSTVLDFTTLGLIPGEWIFIGGDAVTNKFANSENNGFARVKTIATNRLELDKTQNTMLTEASTTEDIQLFFGRVLKNESDPTLIIRRTYNIERTLGAPESTQPTQLQAEYLVGSVPGEFTYNYNTADKVTLDLNVTSTDNEQRTSTQGLKSGSRPDVVGADAFNTSSDFSRLKLAILDPADSNPTALFGFVTEFTVIINNNLSPNKAISVLGAFEVTAGQFNVSGSLTAYFSQVEAVQAVRNNADVTLDFALVKSQVAAGTTIKQGIVTDVPLISLGDGRLTVEQDQPITLPLTNDAGADRNFNHTLLQVFYDFLPDAADS